jgi:D-alanine-D-alanine ligase-like ATP-grasp enzyme
MNHIPGDLPVILLYNLDRSWSPAEVQEILNLVQDLENGLTTVGHPTQTISLTDDNLEEVLAGCDPARQIVFNWCEEIPGVPRSSAQIAQTLEGLGFTYTGADSQALQLSQDKPAIKERLLKEDISSPIWQVSNGNMILDWDCFPAIVKPGNFRTTSANRRLYRRARIPCERCRQREAQGFPHCRDGFLRPSG